MICNKNIPSCKGRYNDGTNLICPHQSCIQPKTTEESISELQTQIDALVQENVNIKARLTVLESP